MTETAWPVQLLVITGMSGAGRSTAGHTLEDLGWYVVDNLPPTMLPELIEVSRQRRFPRVAVVLDVRTRSAFDQIPAAFLALGEAGVTPEILFLDASDEAIVRRQASARRPLPLQGSGRLLDGIGRERLMLGRLRASADQVIDTSTLNVHQLAERVASAYAGPDRTGLRVTVMSFGFKNGIPIDADMILDSRFLPNPHWVPELRQQTGMAESVSAYVLGQADAEPFLATAEELVHLIGPGYLREGKRQATIAIGCTGGKHRSPALANALAERLAADRIAVEVVHRDLGLE